MLAPLELAETGSLLDELPPLLRLRREHRFDLALADDRVHRPAEPDVGEQLDEVGPAHLRLVHEVLALTAAMEPPRDRHLGEVELAEAAALVVEDELDLAALGRGPSLGAVEEHVVRLLGPQLGRRQRAGRPDDRVGDVRLARAVRPDHDGDPGLELQLQRVGKRLEAAQAERAQMHRREASGRRGRRPPPALALLGHAEHVLAAQLPDELGVRLADMPLDLLHELVVVFGPDDLAALAVDHLAHRVLLARMHSAIVLGLACRYLG